MQPAQAAGHVHSAPRHMQGMTVGHTPSSDAGHLDSEKSWPSPRHWPGTAGWALGTLLSQAGEPGAALT